MSFEICQKCGDECEVRYGQEHTGFCDECAQTLVEKLIAALEIIRDHKGWYNCSFAVKERKEFQAIARKVLKQTKG